MKSTSILYCNENAEQEQSNMLECFKDLNLEQIMRDICSGYDKENIEKYFCMPLKCEEDIIYRQNIFRDLQNDVLKDGLEKFCNGMRNVAEKRQKLNKYYCEPQKEWYFAEEIRLYYEALCQLSNQLLEADLKSEGLTRFRNYLNLYFEDETIQNMYIENQRLQKELLGIRYCISIQGSSIDILPYDGEKDYSIEVETFFSRFRQGEVDDYHYKKFAESFGLNTVEERILDCVAKLFPEIFNDMSSYCTKHENFEDENILNFYREIQFYLSCLNYIQSLKDDGLQFCFPKVMQDNKNAYAFNSFDIVLAKKLQAEGRRVITNEFCFKEREHIFLITGANQGGKTTFARMVGQLFYLALLGVPIPGSDAAIFICDHIYTHFEKEEILESLNGKLQDDIIRIHNILERATSNSLIIINEIFSSTTLFDAVTLGKKIIQQITEREILCVCVTFVEEWAHIGDKTVSLVSQVDEKDGYARTYRIIRKDGDGRAYAYSLAQKYGLTYERIKERMQL